MKKVKEYITSKLFWTGMIIGFTLGALHNYFGLQVSSSFKQFQVKFSYDFRLIIVRFKLLKNAR